MLMSAQQVVLLLMYASTQEHVEEHSELNAASLEG
jgi:hypothetical protein